MNAEIADTDGVEAHQRGHDILELKDTRSGAWIASKDYVSVTL
jgi:hypothetical protein